MTSSIDSEIRGHPFWSALILVGVVSAAVLAVSVLFVEPKTELYKAVITLIFSALIGGILKILLDSEFISRSDRSQYQTCFVEPLNEATKHLRAELARIARGDGRVKGTNAEARLKLEPGATQQETAVQPCPSLPAT